MKPLFPKSALAHHIAVLGKTGSGKTSVVKASVIEPAIANDERVCVIDPTGAWWGLRLMADGRKKGFPVYVFGGRHADYPLLGSHGEAMADVIGTTNTPAILDTSLMKTGERMRFFTDFADAILRKNEGPLRLAIDEAHVFMPQAGARGTGQMPDMLHAGNNLISLGRSRGLRIVLISQRAAKLHKDSLTQVETLIALRLIAPQDRQAVRDWIADQADLEKGKDIIASLPKLRDGEGWVWAPEADFLKRIQFPRPLTYDSSAAPSKASSKKKLSPIDLDVLKDRLAKVDAEAREADPKLLRAELAKLKGEKAALERQLTLKSTAAAAPAKPDKAAEANVKKLRAALEVAMKFIVQINAEGFFKAGGEAVDKAAVEKAIGDATKHVTKVIEGHLSRRDHEIAKLRAETTKVLTRLKAISDQDVIVNVDVKHNEPFTIAPSPRPTTAKVAYSGDGTLTNPQLTLLRALAWWQAMGHDRPTRPQVAAIAGWKPTGSNLKDRLSELSKFGFVIYPITGQVQLTPEGAAAAPAPDLGQTLIECIRSVLTGPQLKLFDALRDAGGEISRADLAASLAPPWLPDGSNLKDRLSELSRLELVEYPQKGTVRLQSWVIEQQQAAA
jgi:hypothetical protein